MFADAVESAMDEAGFDTAHVAGNSLGGWVAMQLAERGRARSVVALAPACGWPAGDASWIERLEFFPRMQAQVKAIAPHAHELLATPEGRRRATQFTTVNYEHIPAELLEHQALGVAACDAVGPLTEYAKGREFSLDAERIECPVRIAWGTEDALLPWPAAATRYREEWLPHADLVVLDGVGHCPQLDVPLETTQLILGVTSR